MCLPLLIVGASTTVTLRRTATAQAVQSQI